MRTNLRTRSVLRMWIIRWRESVAEWRWPWPSLPHRSQWGLSLWKWGASFYQEIRIRLQWTGRICSERSKLITAGAQSRQRFKSPKSCHRTTSSDLTLRRSDQSRRVWKVWWKFTPIHHLTNFLTKIQSGFPEHRHKQPTPSNSSQDRSPNSWFPVDTTILKQQISTSSPQTFEGEFQNQLKKEECLILKSKEEMAPKQLKACCETKWTWARS